jgi:A/G-specific adenine glycosylase
MVSEFMLQQTQVSRVEGYYTNFLERYPTIQALAAAHSRSVRESWLGLGYYRRATNLHRLAKEIVRTYDGVIPQEPEKLRALPGVGRYTAGAVAAFAFERPQAAVDTNVARVVQRAFHPRTPPSPTQPKLWHTTQALQPRRGARAWAFNQALMELGAVICRSRTPECRRCPVKRECKTGKKILQHAP